MHENKFIERALQSVYCTNQIQNQFIYESMEL